MDDCDSDWRVEEKLRIVVEENVGKNKKAIIRIVRIMFDQKYPSHKWDIFMKPKYGTLTNFFKKSSQFSFHRVSPGKHMVSITHPRKKKKNRIPKKKSRPTIRKVQSRKKKFAIKKKKKKLKKKEIIINIREKKPIREPLRSKEDILMEKVKQLEARIAANEKELLQKDSIIYKQEIQIKQFQKEIKILRKITDKLFDPKLPLETVNEISNEIVSNNEKEEVSTVISIKEDVMNERTKTIEPNFEISLDEKKVETERKFFNEWELIKSVPTNVKEEDEMKKKNIVDVPEPMLVTWEKEENKTQLVIIKDSEEDNQNDLKEIEEYEDTIIVVNKIKLCDVPREVFLEYIFSCLEILLEIKNLSLVCKTINYNLSDQYLWKSLVEQRGSHFSNYYEKKSFDPNVNYRGIMKLNCIVFTILKRRSGVNVKATWKELKEMSIRELFDEIISKNNHGLFNRIFMKTLEAFSVFKSHYSEQFNDEMVKYLFPSSINITKTQLKLLEKLTIKSLHRRKVENFFMVFNSDLCLKELVNYIIQNVDFANQFFKEYRDGVSLRLEKYVRLNIFLKKLSKPSLKESRLQLLRFLLNKRNVVLFWNATNSFCTFEILNVLFKENPKDIESIIKQSDFVYPYRLERNSFFGLLLNNRNSILCFQLTSHKRLFSCYNYVVSDLLESGSFKKYVDYWSIFSNVYITKELKEKYFTLVFQKHFSFCFGEYSIRKKGKWVNMRDFFSFFESDCCIHDLYVRFLKKLFSLPKVSNFLFTGCDSFSTCLSFFKSKKSSGLSLSKNVSNDVIIGNFENDVVDYFVSSKEKLFFYVQSLYSFIFFMKNNLSQKNNQFRVLNAFLNHSLLFFLHVNSADSLNNLLELILSSLLNKKEANLLIEKCFNMILTAKELFNSFENHKVYGTPRCARAKKNSEMENFIIKKKVNVVSKFNHKKYYESTYFEFSFTLKEFLKYMPNKMKSKVFDFVLKNNQIFYSVINNVDNLIGFDSISKGEYRDVLLKKILVKEQRVKFVTPTRIKSYKNVHFFLNFLNYNIFEVINMAKWFSTHKTKIIKFCLKEVLERVNNVEDIEAFLKVFPEYEKEVISILQSKK